MTTCQANSDKDKILKKPFKLRDLSRSVWERLKNRDNLTLFHPR